MKVLSYTVHPEIPEPLKPLEELAHNLWVSWNFEAVALFIRLDYDAWLHSNQNPARVLGAVSQQRYEELATDDSFVSAVNSVYEKFLKYRNGTAWYSEQHPKPKGDKARDVIAYFSMEYGLDVSLPIYSGGLGILSGDHVKTSSDLGLPLVAVGLLYRQGYFKQYLNADGFQQESYPENDWYNMPVTRCLTADGDDVKITVKIIDAIVTARVWEVKVGRNSLYLLDTNIDENTDEYKHITATLYGGNRETRIQQEILLGIGGIRALRALGINPTVTHMNEGHSAFLGIERIREHMELDGLSFDEAKQALWPTNIFTTHTPVPAGNERFSIETMQKYFDSVTVGTGISWDDLMALGRENPTDTQEHFCMTVLALRLSAYNNGVSVLHGDVSREMWRNVWPGLSRDEVPIGSITNGVHPRTWLSHDMLDLLDRYFGPRFENDPVNLDIWDRIDRVSDEELWRTHERRKSRLVAFARERLKEQLAARGASGAHLGHASEVLSPNVLTICFARRFATYKRAMLLFRDPVRLKKLLSDPERPIQIIFAGKAHPHDIPGKNLIKDIVHFAGGPDVRSRIVFLENYDMTMAKYLVSGADLWLNTPRRPLEASGTSGMKAAINGVLNCSVLDGWWAEAYRPEIGYAIGRGEVYADEEMQDEIESKALYDLLEREIVPTFYDTGLDGLPREWIRKMKATMREIGKQFSSHRMLHEYADSFYTPALENGVRFAADNYRLAKDAAAYVARLRNHWSEIAIDDIVAHSAPRLNVGETLEIEATVRLGALQPEEVAVELYFGQITSQGDFDRPSTIEMSTEGAAHNGTRVYRVSVPCGITGQQGCSVRVVPKDHALVHPYIPGFVIWA